MKVKKLTLGDLLMGHGMPTKISIDETTLMERRRNRLAHYTVLQGKDEYGVVNFKKDVEQMKFLNEVLHLALTKLRQQPKSVVVIEYNLGKSSVSITQTMLVAFDASDGRYSSN
ncbi:MAG TPA: hypothetical protein PK760_11880 [Flavobacteriales bacterium]|nr:hypothetical protein [Flavobacteriales bacterium]